VANGGHGILEEDLRRRYITSFKNLEQALPLCDRVYFYDNSRDNVRGVLNPLAIVQNGKIISCRMVLPDL